MLREVLHLLSGCRDMVTHLSRLQQLDKITRTLLQNSTAYWLRELGTLGMARIRIYTSIPTEHVMCEKTNDEIIKLHNHKTVE